MVKTVKDGRIFVCSGAQATFSGPKDPCIEQETGEIKKSQNFPILLSTFSLRETPVL
jgi:hypothetical protein